VNFAILDSIAELCAAKGVSNVIICPGSRSAPLTLAFTRNKRLKCWTFSDERSAAFVGLGMAQQTGQPVVLVCTSGSAAYNFSPAVAEAWFQQIPLIVFTADRPKEWIDQFDGQTIRQTELFGKHVKRFVELPGDYVHKDSEWFANRVVNESLNLAQTAPMGPVHINAPFREPLYPDTNKTVKSKPATIITPVNTIGTLSGPQFSLLKKELAAFKKVLIVAGQQDHNPNLLAALRRCHSKHKWAAAGDILSNAHSLPFFCSHTDTFLGQLPETKKKELQPELLITFGKSLISKNLKLFLRQYKPKQHWHLQENGETADTFQSLTRTIAISPTDFFGQIADLTAAKSQVAYNQTWEHAESSARKAIGSFFKADVGGELHLVQKILQSLPRACNLHLANSMSVRYANHIGLSTKHKAVAVFSNRGTSGIDGCTSTVVGHALTSGVPNVLITGDLALFYDRNAFWHNYKLANLMIVVLNNHGGIIFNLIDGPSRLAEAKEFFITNQRLNARSLATEAGLIYVEGQKSDLEKFFKPSKAGKILELESTQEDSKRIFEQFKKQIKKSYET
jgi:2-succinyl-5-enolpyruvyl-6-hydroxy-3-cyclohexene-1-carboxylate synthase